MFVCDFRAGITFVSVHDCYWTHPADVETMTKVRHISAGTLYSILFAMQNCHCFQHFGPINIDCHLSVLIYAILLAPSSRYILS